MIFMGKLNKFTAFMGNKFQPVFGKIVYRNMRVSKVHPATPASSRLPYQYYIYNGEYPLVRTIYALLNDPRRGLPWGFAHFIEGPKGQRIVMKAGLLPVLGQINVRDVNVSQ